MPGKNEKHILEKDDIRKEQEHEPKSKTTKIQGMGTHSDQSTAVAT